MKKTQEKSSVGRLAGRVSMCLMLAFCAAAAAQGTLPAEVPAGDFNGDGRVDAADLAVLSSQWHRRLAWGPWECSPPRLVAHYRFDGDATDSAGDNDGVVFGTPVWLVGRDAAVGSGAVALEDGDYIAVADNGVFDVGRSITVAVWIKTAAVSAPATIVSKEGAWRFRVEVDGRMSFACEGLDMGGEITGQADVADDTWRHVACVYDGDEGQIILYVDGQVDALQEASGRIDSSDCQIRIGGNAAAPQEHWNGWIDDLRLYNCAMTAEQIFNRMTWHVDAANGRDTFTGQGKGRAFRTIQRAIDMAADGDEVLVWPGVYTEAIVFMGKAITVRSMADAAVIQAPGDFAVNFYFGEQESTVLQNFVIANSEIGIFVEGSRPTIRNVTVVNNGYGLEAYTGSRPAISNSIFWNNSHSDIFNDTYAPQITFSCLERFAAGEENISADPMFAEPAAGDYHLASEMGRFVADGQPSNSGAGGGYWVQDERTSPCIDAGDPTLNPMGEMMPNGARVNMGAFGGTAQASKSPWPLKCDANNDGKVDAYDLRMLAENWLCGSQESQE